MVSKSELFAFRLHPDDEREADAIDVIKSMQKSGYTVRQIVTDAILRAGGHTPEMYRSTDDLITKGFIEQTLGDFAQHLLAELRAKGAIVSTGADSGKLPFDSEEDLQVAQNLANGYLARRKRGR